MTSETFELELQRLVDGELSPPRIGSLLQVAESRPGLWRELALAFVEQQVLRREASRFASTSVGSSVRENDDPLDGESDEGWEPVERDFSRPRSAGGPWGAHPGLRWLAAAAAMLLMLPLGFRLGQWHTGGPIAQSPRWGNASQSGEVRSNESAHGPATQLASLDLTQRAIAPYRVRLVNDEGQPLVDKEIPLIPLTLASEMGIRLPQLTIPDDIQNEYRQAGYQLQPRVRWMSGRLDDGREVFIPVQDLTLVAYGQ